MAIVSSAASPQIDAKQILVGVEPTNLRSELAAQMSRDCRLVKSGSGERFLQGIHHEAQPEILASPQQTSGFLLSARAELKLAVEATELTSRE